MDDLEKAKRERLRWKILQLVEHERPGAVEEGVLREALQDVGREELRRELRYLESRKLVQIDARRPDEWRVTMTWPGIDLVDYEVDCEPGIARPAMDEQAFAKATRGRLRWRILSILNLDRDRFMFEELILQTLTDAEVDASPARLRRNLDYLERRGLVELERPARDEWRARINHHGIDIVEYAVDCAPGIARPRKW
jgi:hypothetical protein